jgi:hypothetical protein
MCLCDAYVLLVRSPCFYDHWAPCTLNKGGTALFLSTYGLSLSLPRRSVVVCNNSVHRSLSLSCLYPFIISRHFLYLISISSIALNTQSSFPFQFMTHLFVCCSVAIVRDRLPCLCPSSSSRVRRRIYVKYIEPHFVEHFFVTLSLEYSI